jgi:hypothetical protein
MTEAEKIKAITKAVITAHLANGMLSNVTAAAVTMLQPGVVKSNVDIVEVHAEEIMRRIPAEVFE